MEGAEVQVQQQHDPYDDETEDASEDDNVSDDSSDEEYNQKNFGIYQALPVEGEPNWTLGE